MPRDRGRSLSPSRSRSPRRQRTRDLPRHDTYSSRGDRPDRSSKNGSDRRRGRDIRSRSRSIKRNASTDSKKRSASRSRSRSRSPRLKRRSRSPLKKELRSDSRKRFRRYSHERRSRSGSKSLSPPRSKERGVRKKRSRERDRSASSSSESDHGSRRKRKKDKEHKGSKSKERRKERKREKKEKKEKKKQGTSTSQWGKYGIISDADIFSKAPEFYAWLVEERKINPETITKDQNKKEFTRYVEDFNTATLPHEKYYHMEAYERRMSALRQGEFIPPPDDAYDPQADMKAISGAHKKKLAEHESYLSKEQLLELRKVQHERIEAGKMKLLGMDVKQNMGVRMDGTAFDEY